MGRFYRELVYRSLGWVHLEVPFGWPSVRAGSLQQGKPRHVRAEVRAPAVVAVQGRELPVAWAFPSELVSLSACTVHLECFEHTIYGRGTEENHDECLIYQQLVVGPSRELRGGASIPLPDDLPPTFRSEHNALVWVIRLRAQLLPGEVFDQAFTLPIVGQPIAAA